MRSEYKQITKIVDRCLRIPGDFAEFGVWRGEIFIPLAERAIFFGKRCLAIDSFCGMPNPSEKDVDENGVQHYQKGFYDIGGVEVFKKLVFDLPNVVIYAGFVPEILDKVEVSKGLAFAHIDLDHYKTTLSALLWAWERMSPGGILCSHDWFPNRSYLAAGGIRAFMDAKGLKPSHITGSNHIWWKKNGS